MIVVRLLLRVLLLSLLTACAARGAVSAVPAPNESPAAGRPAAARKADAALLAAIDRAVGDVEANVHRLRRVDRDLPGLSSEGGAVSGYFDANSVRLVHVQLYGEMGTVAETYYFDEQHHLAFAEVDEALYDRPFYEAGWTVASTTVSRYYFVDGQLVHRTVADIPQDLQDVRSGDEVRRLAERVLQVRTALESEGVSTADRAELPQPTLPNVYGKETP